MHSESPEGSTKGAYNTWVDVCRVLCAKVVGATSSEEFLVNYYYYFGE